MTVQEALRGSGLGAADARLLLAHATGQAGAALVAHPQRELAPEAAQRFAGLAARRREGEPLAYLVGRKAFYDLELEVGPALLIPRPETELLVELALERPWDSAVDLGTGSGAIALALKKHRPAARLVGVDRSAAALDVARRNAVACALEVEFREGRWFEPLAGEIYALVVANPPYVAANDPHLEALRFEPPEALVSGIDGLDAIREIAAQAGAYLSLGGWLLLEHGAGQDAAVRRILEAAGLEATATWPDLAGIGRVSGGIHARKR